ncbi:MurR/RpiR family transcriptional regulator [Companilactobacillus huachuanensis]|uniref:MurR/RpiR family transcriptional regulator n=1 Tax=Companilactobacillus huachuanensis TaxID=2559914 RepID=A0ABW1RQA5_9LACO|nr:MurR/RpiR family transcriptional regulator [Companilactobacillus huachuanensis]
MILEKIEQRYKSLSRQQKLLADYVLKNPKEVMNSTSKELAEKSGVSTATVVRFAQQLDLDSFADFKIAIASQLSSGKVIVDTVIEKDDTSKIMSEKLEQVYASSIQKSFSMIKEADLNHAVELINKATHVYILGVGTSGLIAYDLYHKLNRYGIKTFYETDAHMNLEFLTNATKDDVVVAISYSGKTKEVGIGAEYAKEHHIPVIAITREDTPLVENSDVCLCIPDNERTIRVAAIASKISTMYITDLLFISVMQLRYGGMKESAIRTNQLINKLKEK